VVFIETAKIIILIATELTLYGATPLVIIQPVT